MFEFRLPDLGEGVAEGEVLEWHVAPGDRVTEDDVLAEVETDKAAVEVPSPVDGVARELRYDEGDVVEVGAVLLTIETDEATDADDATSGEREPPEAGATGDGDAAGGTGEEAAPDSAATATGGRVFAPPNVRRLARELGVDVGAVTGSGPSGRVTEGDVRAAAEDEGIGETDADGEADEESDERELRSAVSRVGDGGDGSDAESGGEADGETDERPEPAIRRVGEPTIETADGDEGGPAVKSADGRVDATAGRERTLATPKARKVASDLGVDVDEVPTTETRDGEAYVSEAAVREHARDQRVAQEEATAAGEERPTRREPYRGVRRTTGERMARARREVPHATHYDRAVVPGLVEARERLQPLAEERDVRLTYTPFVLKSVAAALREHPVLNTELDAEAEEIVYKEYYDLGVATATDAGLLVPVVEAVDEKNVLELAREVEDLVARARDRSIDRSELQGGTFTVTNFGAIGGEYADPVINVPQTAILGVGSLTERPVAEDGAVSAEPTLPLSLAIDHRVIDGADAARFVNTLKEYLADPTRLLLE